LQYIQRQQDNALLMDPNKIEIHHLLPEQLLGYFAKYGIDINDPEFLLPMTAGDHRLKPDGVHTGPWLDSWNGQMSQWLDGDPLNGLTPEDKRRVIEQQLTVMKQQFPTIQKYLPK
jgi:hypothetical protein